MKYTVWFLISPYDGYATDNYDTWDEALARAKLEIEERFPKQPKKIQIIPTAGAANLSK